MTKKQLNPKEMAELACDALSDKKGSDILTIDIAEKTIIADYFVICSGRSNTQVRALADHVDERFSKAGMQPLRRDGYGEDRWIVLDYGAIIVHIFHDETRLFYNLERLWDSGTNVKKVT